MASSDADYNYLGPTIGHRYIIENTWDAFHDALTPTSSQYGLTGIWFLIANYSLGAELYRQSRRKPRHRQYRHPATWRRHSSAACDRLHWRKSFYATGLNYVTFQGITFEVDNFYPNSIGFNNDANGEMSLPQALDCENCQYVTFNTVTIRHTSAICILPLLLWRHPRVQEHTLAFS